MTTTQEETKEERMLREFKELKWPMLAANDVPVTPDMIGRRVRFKTYENYQNQNVREGIGIIQGISYQHGQVYIQMPFKRITYFRGYSSGESDLITMHTDFRFAPFKASCLDYKRDGYQYDYPHTWHYEFEILPESTEHETTQTPTT